MFSILVILVWVVVTRLVTSVLIKQYVLTLFVIISSFTHFSQSFKYNSGRDTQCSNANNQPPGNNTVTIFDHWLYLSQNMQIIKILQQRHMVQTQNASITPISGHQDLTLGLYWIQDVIRYIHCIHIQYHYGNTTTVQLQWSSHFSDNIRTWDSIYL